MANKDVCSECRLDQVESGSSLGLCSECYATLKGTLRKLDEYEFRGYLG